jgi:hypothetical protein
MKQSNFFSLSFSRFFSLFFLFALVWVSSMELHCMFYDHWETWSFAIHWCFIIHLIVAIIHWFEQNWNTFNENLGIAFISHACLNQMLSTHRKICWGWNIFNLLFPMMFTMFPNSSFYVRMKWTPLWLTYIGDKGRTLGKGYGIKWRAIGNTLGTNKQN